MNVFEQAKTVEDRYKIVDDIIKTVQELRIPPFMIYGDLVDLDFNSANLLLDKFKATIEATN